jgi:hypothetical protein
VFRNYHREADPFQFWTIVILTASAGVMGLMLFCFGVAMLASLA